MTKDGDLRCRCQSLGGFHSQRRRQDYQCCGPDGGKQIITKLNRDDGCYPDQQTLKTKDGSFMIFSYDACKKWLAVRGTDWKTMSYGEKSVLADAFTDRSGMGTRLDDGYLNQLDSWKKTRNPASESTQIDDDWSTFRRVMSEGCQQLGAYQPEAGTAGGGTTSGGSVKKGQ